MNIFTVYIQAYIDLMYGDYDIEASELENVIENIKEQVRKMSVDEILTNVIDCVEDALMTRDIEDEEMNENFIN